MDKSLKILVTGGAGYIGSHCILRLIELGYKNIVSIDNFSNSTSQSLNKIKDYTGSEISNESFDLRDSLSINTFFKKHSDVDTIIHFAALKNPFVSINNAQNYYENNVSSLINLLKFSSETNLSKFIFSSTCAIYGEPNNIPVKENHSINPQNPYASSKWMGENILKDIAKNRNVKAVSLRYFNPIGSNSSVGLKEFYTENSKNIVPQILKVLKNEQKVLNIFGNKLPTKDGSGVRDFIHVEDLAEAHIKAMEFLAYSSSSFNYDVYNLGTGNGISVFELINEFQKVMNRNIPINIEESRISEVAEIYADSSKLNKIMNWYAKKDLNRMVLDTLRSNELIG
ncbi:MAG: UDP-glucose 4-epimerase GalE [Bacteroidota bacterium]